jgi:hypothetical protein
MEKQTLASKVLKEVRNFETNKIYLTDKVTFSQLETVKKIITHQNNGFQKASDKKRFFFNIGNSRVDTGVKKIDFDTKDISATVENEPGLSMLLGQEIRQFCKDYRQGERINNLVENFVDWGNVVVKEDDDEFYKEVSISNLYLVDTCAETLEDTTVIEKHSYSATELVRFTEWDNVQEVIEEFSENEDNPQFDVYERYGQMSLAEFKDEKGEEINDEDENKYIETLSIVITPKRTTQNRQYFGESMFNLGRLAFLSEIKPKKGKDGKYRAKPYREAHFGAYQGRWLRKGYREILFDYQDRANSLGNQIYEAMKFSALHLFWSQDNSLAGKNVFKSLAQGDIIQANHMAVLPVEERNLSAHVGEWNRLMELADRECQSFEVATGEGLPSGTTLGSVQIQTQAVGQYYDYKREKLGEFMETIYNDWITPKLIKELTAEHVLEVTGSNEYLDTFYQSAANGYYLNNLLNLPPHDSQMADMFKQQIVDQMKKQPKFMVKVTEGAFKGIDARVQVNITGENINKQNRMTNGMQLLNIVANPNITQNEEARKLATQIASELGFNLNIKAAPQPQPQDGLQQQTAPGANQVAQGTQGMGIAQGAL